MRRFILLATAALVFTGQPAQAQIVLMDQIGANPALLNTTGNIAASQRFSDFPTFDIGTGDNFSVVGGSFRLSHVQGVMNGFNGFTAAHYSDGILTQWAVEIYSSTGAATANLNGDVAHLVFAFNSASVTTTPYAIDPQRLVDFDVFASNVVLAPGTYHVAIIASMPFGAGGQIGPVDSNVVGGFPNDVNGWQANPAGGFNIPGNFQSTNANEAYRVTGFLVGVPEPSTMILLGAGSVVVTGIGWRRHRARAKALSATL